MSKEVKAAWIGGICAIIAAIFGGLSLNVNIDMDDIKDNIKAYKKVQLENTEIKTINNDLQNQITFLTEENVSLMAEIQNLENELQAYSNDTSEKIYIQDFSNINTDDKIIQITTVTARIHTTPENSSNIIAIAKHDDKILLRRTVIDEDKSEWYEVFVGNQIGYVHSYLAKQIE